MSNPLVVKVRRTCRVAWQRRWLALAAMTIVAVCSAIGISMFHDRYQATARVYVNTQTVLKPLMQSLTFQPDIDQQVSMLARTLISRPNVEKLVADPSLELDRGDAAERDGVISRLMGDIKVVPAGAGNLYDVSYRGTSPERARRLVAATVGLFVDSGAGDKKRDSQEARTFIDEQIHSYEGKLVDAENRLKDFKVRNFGVTGVSNQDYFSRVSALTEEVSKLRVDLSAAEQSRDTYRRELTSENPQLPLDLASFGAAAPGSMTARIDEQRKTLDELLRRYTDEHPDVVNARRVLAQLEAEAQRRKVEEQALARSGHGSSAATSPVYQKLRISIAEAEALVASLHSQLVAKQALLEQVRADAGRQPQAEAELAQLNRDYDILRKNYDTMVARRESAALGVKLDESSQLAEFKVVEPPRVLPTPVFPSQAHLAVIALLLSLVSGIAAAVAADLVWPTFDDKESLRQFTGRPVLGSLSMLTTEAGLARRRAGNLRFAVVLGLMMAAQVAWVVATALHPHTR
ncbi:MAG: chain length-determining protein [Pseudomonadota bacterium]|nr:chain length-determining protein [Pseudomonadota bacterium]